MDVRPKVNVIAGGRVKQIHNSLGCWTESECNFWWGLGGSYFPDGVNVIAGGGLRRFIIPWMLDQRVNVHCWWGVGGSFPDGC